jgi:hypothetical protein
MGLQCMDLWNARAVSRIFTWLAAGLGVAYFGLVAFEVLRTRKSAGPLRKRLAQHGTYLGLGVWWSASGAYYLWGDRWDDWLTWAVLGVAIAVSIALFVVCQRRLKIEQVATGEN